MIGITRYAAFAAINKESIDAVRTAIHELETAGYVVRSRVRDERGLLRGCEYFVYEYPHTEDSDVENRDDFSVPPVLETPVSDSTAQENPTQLNKEIPNKEKQNTDPILSDTDTVREQVQENIELDLLCRNMPEAAPVFEEISELIVETVQNQNSTQRLGINIFPADLVRSRLMQLTSEHIRYVLESLRTHTAPTYETQRNTYYRMLVQCASYNDLAKLCLLVPFVFQVS